MSPDEQEPFAVAPHLERLLAREDLDFEAARACMRALVAGRLGGPALAALLTALRAKGESETELAAFAGVLREQAVPIQAPPGTLDTCGTGGDHSGTFNISTATALAAAGMGIPVAKHGNRSVSSRSGSADVLKELGVNIEASPAQVERCLREAGAGFLFAPALHPGMKHAAPVRRALGIRTVFNLLGPLANPAGAKRQLLGVFDPRWCAPLARVLHALGSEAAAVVCGAGPPGGSGGTDGSGDPGGRGGRGDSGGGGYLDEVSTWGPTTVAWLEEGAVRVETFEARRLGVAVPAAAALSASGPEQSARIIRHILDGRPGAARDVVALNAAAAAMVAGRAGDWAEGVALAEESLDSGRARTVLEKLAALSNAD